MANEHKNSAISIARPPLTTTHLELFPKTYDAFNDTNTNDETEHTVATPKYGPLDNLGPSHKLYTHKMTRERMMERRGMSMRDDRKS